MKLALDVWYELWENVGKEAGPDPDRRPDEVERHYPRSEDHLLWIRDTKPRTEYYASLSRMEPR